jgi:hypothetical protein
LKVPFAQIVCPEALAVTTKTSCKGAFVVLFNVMGGNVAPPLVVLIPVIPGGGAGIFQLIEAPGVGDVKFTNVVVAPEQMV